MSSADRIVHTLSKYNKLIIEFIGTFFLVLTVGMIKAQGTAVGAAGPLAIGSSLMVNVFAGGHISGAHFNPAVTFGVWLSGRGKISGITSIQYCLVQLFASLCAGLTYWAITDHTFSQKPEGSTSGQAFVAELLYTALLVHVVLNVATTKSNTENSFYGLAIGFTVVAGAVAVGNVSGGVFNPAVGFGPIMVNAFNDGGDKLKNIWIYFLAPLLGSLLSALLFRVTNHHSEFTDPDMSDLNQPLNDHVPSL